MRPYDPGEIEPRWQATWENQGLYEAKDFSPKPKFYALMEFPYPSGDGLHTGHIKGFTAMDIIARKRRMEGYNVLYPIGWDAFGLPTENYAIKTKTHPKVVTKNNTDIFRSQLKSVGFSFDWTREINTTDPTYYKWTQWIFLKLFEKGLAYKARTFINWCTVCQIGLANEEVVAGVCERCGGMVEKREKEQWMLAITKYADRLYNDLDRTDFVDIAKIQQRHWIGPSEGAELNFKVAGRDDLSVKVFTTRPDTIFGVTYVVIAPEHPLITELSFLAENKVELGEYVNLARRKTDLERTADEREKTGMELRGVTVVNPASGQTVPLFVADYVLGDYGTGAVMAVPAHDTRDYLFAKKYNLPIMEVISGGDIKTAAYIEPGLMVNSGQFNGRASAEVQKEITVFAGGEWTKIYKLRDWVFSRQRYWGEPIPMVKCPACAKTSAGKLQDGWVPVPEGQLPVTLPNVENYQPAGSGESPLAALRDWVETTCPKCGGPAERETDTMPNWAGSSWYFLRYLDPTNDEMLADPDKLKYWGRVDWYNGGPEHITLHLLYSRFWNKFLYDLGVVPNDEPYIKRTIHGMILGAGGVKMSKSKGNVVSPDQIIKTYGADTLRLYEMFMGPFEQTIAWDEKSIIGPRRFLEKVWRLAGRLADDVANEKLVILVNQTIAKVSADIETMSFNTAISKLMILTNELEKEAQISKNLFAKVLIILAPFAPHLTEELWSEIGRAGSVHQESWPVVDQDRLQFSLVKIAIQINGKVRAEMEIPLDADENMAKNKAITLPTVDKWLVGKEIKKTVFVKNRLLGFVV